MMNRTLEKTPRPARTAAALAGVAGMLVLAGCSTAGATAEETAAPEPTTQEDASTPETAETSDGAADEAAAGAYADGTYTAEGSYATPESVETISVSLTIAGDVVTAVEVQGDPQRPESERYQSEFIGGISDVVVGQPVDDLQVSRVAGSSLTSGGFNDALESIKAEAAA